MTPKQAVAYARSTYRAPKRTWLDRVRSLLASVF
jgi:hypothetical protein